MAESSEVITDPMPIRIMTVKQAADYLGLAVSTLNKWRCLGGGPKFVKMGRAVRYRAEDLEAYLNVASRASTSV